MAKHSRRRKRSYRASNRRRYHARNRNPFFGKRRHYHRRRNPGMGGTISEITGLILWGTGGAIVSRALPQLVLQANNTGFVGYFANLLVAVLGGGLVGRFAKGNSGSRFTAGGVIATGLRIFSDYFGSQAQQFGLSGDLDFDLGYYVPNSFPLPTTGAGPWLLNPGQSGYPMAAGGVPGSPAAAAIQAAAGAGGAGTTVTVAPSGSVDEPQRWASRWAA